MTLVVGSRSLVATSALFSVVVVVAVIFVVVKCSWYCCCCFCDLLVGVCACCMLTDKCIVIGSAPHQ